MILSLTACAVKRDPASTAGWCCHCYSIKQEFAQLFALAKTLDRPKIPASGYRTRTRNAQKFKRCNVFLHR